MPSLFCTAFLQRFDDRIHTLFQRQSGGIDGDIRIFRNIIRAGNSGKVRNLSGACLPVKAFDIARSHSSSGVLIYTSKKLSLPMMSRADFLSLVYGEIKEVITISPASFISFETSEIRRIFSIRSDSLKPRFPVKPHAHIIPVEKHCVSAERDQAFFQFICHGRLSGTG